MNTCWSNSFLSVSQYLGKLLNRVANKSVELDTGFHYKHLGSFCFIGSEHAVAEFAGSFASLVTLALSRWLHTNP